MEKPISMVIDDTQKSLSDIVNNCGLHPVIIEMILKDLYMNVCSFNITNTKKEREQYLQESTQNKE